MDVTTQESITLIYATKRDEVLRTYARIFQINKQRHRTGMPNLIDYERIRLNIILAWEVKQYKKNIITFLLIQL